jgi:hypothetical protein
MNYYLIRILKKELFSLDKKMRERILKKVLELEKYPELVVFPLFLQISVILTKVPYFMHYVCFYLLLFPYI